MDYNSEDNSNIPFGNQTWQLNTHHLVPWCSQPKMSFCSRIFQPATFDYQRVGSLPKIILKSLHLEMVSFHPPSPSDSEGRLRPLSRWFCNGLPRILMGSLKLKVFRLKVHSFHIISLEVKILNPTQKMEASFRTCPYFWVPTFQTLLNSPSTIKCDPLRCEEWTLDAGCAHSADNLQRYCSNLMLGKPTTTSINSIQESLWILLNPFESVYLGVSWMGQKDSQHLRLLGTQKRGDLSDASSWAGPLPWHGFTISSEKPWQWWTWW